MSYFILWKTPFGLRLRSVGEDPDAADSLGVPVYRMKFIAVMVSGALSGLAGPAAHLETVSGVSLPQVEPDNAGRR